MDPILAAMETVTDLIGSVFDVMTGNPLLTVFLAAGLVGVGIGVFRKVRGATGARG